MDLPRLRLGLSASSQFLISLSLTISRSRYLISPHHSLGIITMSPFPMRNISSTSSCMVPKYLLGGRKTLVDLRGGRGCVKTGSDWFGSSGSLARYSWETFSLSLIILPMLPSWINYFSKKIVFRLTITLWSFEI